MPSLTTLARVKTELGISGTADDAHLQDLILASSDMLTSRCNRHFHYAPNWVDEVPSYGQHRLIVRHAPLLEVTSITYDGGLVDAGNYSISDAAKGWIFSRGGWLSMGSLWGGVVQPFPYAGSEVNAYTIVYAGGYVTPQQASDDPLLTRTLPYDLELACIQATVSLYRAKGQDRRIASESLLSYSVAYKDSMAEVPEVASVIRRYRRIGTSR